MPFSSTSIVSGPYTPNGVTTDFSFFFLALSADEVQVYLTDEAGDETILTGYDITGIGDAAGGTISFPTAPTYEDATLSIRAVPSFANETDFENQGAYNPSDVNRSFDRSAQRSIYLANLIAAGGGSNIPANWATLQDKPDLFPPSAHTHAASDIVSGTLAAGRIPALDAVKIATGTLDAARVPGLDAGKIVSGTIDPARLPPVSGAVVSSGDLTDLTVDQQADIVEGTTVYTSDGTRYVYNGAGSKVDVASYTEIPDAAPDWSTVGSKPANVTAFAALVGAADRSPYFTGVGTLSLTPLTAAGRTVMGGASAAAILAGLSPLTTKGDLLTYGAANARLPVGANGQALVADSAEALGMKWANVSSSTGIQNAANFVTVFSGNGDGATNNNAAFAAAEASVYARIYLPEGTFLISGATAITSVPELKKMYVGPGRISWGGTYFFQPRALLVNPGYNTDLNSDYGEDKVTKFTDAWDIKVDPTPARHRLNLNSTQNSYFAKQFHPNWITMTVAENGGYGGLTARMPTGVVAGATSVVTDILATQINGAISAGVTEVVVDNATGFAAGKKIRLGEGTVYEERVLTEVAGTTLKWAGGAASQLGPTGVTANAYADNIAVSLAPGLVVGQDVGFGTVMDDVQEIKTLTNIVGGTLYWATGLANSYPKNANPIAGELRGPSVTKGKRTWNSAYMVELYGQSAGDNIAYGARLTAGYVPTAGQKHFFNTQTTGVMEGDITLTTEGNYAKVTEFSIVESDAATGGNGAISEVRTFYRKKPFGYGAVWGGYYITAAPSAGFESEARCDFAFNIGGSWIVGFDTFRADFTGGAAVNLKSGHRIYFNSASTTYGHPTLARGEGYYGNLLGDTWMGHDDAVISTTLDGTIAAGATSAVLTSVAGFAVGNRVRFLENGGQYEDRLVATINAGTRTITWFVGLINGYASGKSVSNYIGNWSIKNGDTILTVTPTSITMNKPVAITGSLYTSLGMTIASGGLVVSAGGANITGPVTLANSIACINVTASGIVTGANFITVGAGTFTTLIGYYVGGNKVVGPQSGAITNTTLDLGVACTTINSILVALRTHGLIAT